MAIWPLGIQRSHKGKLPAPEREQPIIINPLFYSPTTWNHKSRVSIALWYLSVRFTDLARDSLALRSWTSALTHIRNPEICVCLAAPLYQTLFPSRIGA